jgi:nucleoside-diphosphate-sugar epimerase
MTAISPANGPVAVTGASGYIGSWVVHDLLAQGYQVRACVRDRNRAEKVDHLLAMNDDPGLRGQLELFEGDLFEPGSYDVAFAGAAGVVHTAAPLGYNQETPQQTYDGCFTHTRDIIAAVQKAGGSVKRLVFTSSFAAVTFPCDDGYVFTEKDWADSRPEAYNGAWSEENIPKNRGIAYKMAKSASERLLYDTAEQDGSFEALSIMPGYVIGPVMCANHDQKESFQYWIKMMMQGHPYGKTRGGRMQWTICDVRDVARAHRLCLERSGNGSRYIVGATDLSGVLFTWQLQQRLHELFPGVAKIGGEEMDGDSPVQPTPDNQRAFSLLAMAELGLEPHAANDTIRDTVNSYYAIGLL